MDGKQRARRPSLGARALRAGVVGIVIAGLIVLMHWIRRDGETAALAFAASALTAAVTVFLLDVLPRPRPRRRSVRVMSLSTALVGALLFTANGLFGGADWTPSQWMAAVLLGAVCGAGMGALIGWLDQRIRRRESVAA